MSGYYCEACTHGTCFVWTDEISDEFCNGIAHGHPMIPNWIWNAPEGVPDPRLKKKSD